MSTDSPLRTVPVLQNWQPEAGHFVFEQDTMWSLNLGDVGTQSHWAELLVTTAVHELAAHTVVPLLRVDESVVDDHPRLRIVIDSQVDVPGSNSPEAFTLDVRPDALTIQARSAQGARWALNALTQLTQSHEVACGTAHDWPDYPVRGFMLDVGRRFASPGFVHALIKQMSHNNLNTLIVHLNDNEIAKDTGRDWADAQHGFRLASDNPKFADLASADGHYTRTNWEELEDTAAQYGVTLVPEIDAPAHSRSVIAQHPELGLNGGHSDMLDLGKPETLAFMQELFAEFLPWFRGPSVHFGADEYDHDLPEEYREYFNSMAQFLRENGKVPWAWGSLTTMAGDQPRAQGYDRDVTICAWNNDWYGGREALTDGYRIINMIDTHLYLVPFADYYHGEHLDGPKLWDEWEPHVFGAGQDVPAGDPQLLGSISALWNDLVLLDYDENTMARMLAPTFVLLAQKMWSGSVPGVSHEQFMARVGQLPEFLDGLYG